MLWYAAEKVVFPPCFLCVKLFDFSQILLDLFTFGVYNIVILGLRVKILLPDVCTYSQNLKKEEGILKWE